MWTYDESMAQKRTARSDHPCPIHEIRPNPVPFGSDAALKSRGDWCFFEDVGVEGFLAFQDSVDQM